MYGDDKTNVYIPIQEKRTDTSEKTKPESRHPCYVAAKERVLNTLRGSQRNKIKINQKGTESSR